ncbi:hypothetical protein JTB14_028471 [Gonioctena quinquepunctata]|nr:hypothetical protein JTB14_028471 [Gonioctena quinquepunctata]
MALSKEDNILTEGDLLKSAIHKDTPLGIEAKNTPSISGNDKEVTKGSGPPLRKERIESLRTGTSARPQYH